MTKQQGLDWSQLMPEDVLAASKKVLLWHSSRLGQLVSSLRLSPDRSGNENIMMRLDSVCFALLGGRCVQAKIFQAIESVSRQRRSAQGNTRGQTKTTKITPEETNEPGYKVSCRCRSPAPQVGSTGKQAELRFSDIIFIAQAASLSLGA